MQRLLWVYTLTYLSIFSVGAYANCGGVRNMTDAEIIESIANGKVKQQVACGLQINEEITINNEKLTPLQFAASLGKPTIVEQVLKAGADPNYGGDGEVILYPLELALASKKYEAAKVLIKNKARANYKLPHSGMTALMTIAFDSEIARKTDVLMLLISRGAEVNGADNKGNTPLHWAARLDNIGYVRALLRSKADKCAKNNKGQRPIDVAANGSAEFGEMLVGVCGGSINVVPK